jgi:hypothetical protein
MKFSVRCYPMSDDASFILEKKEKKYHPKKWWLYVWIVLLELGYLWKKW